MIPYSAYSKSGIFVKGYWYLPFPKNIVKNIGKKISKNLSGKYNQMFMDHIKQSPTEGLKTISTKANGKIEQAIGDLIGNKITNRIAKVSRS